MMHNSHTEVGIMFFSSDRFDRTPKNVQAATLGGTSTGRRQGRLESKRLRHYLAIWLMMMARRRPDGQSGTLVLGCRFGDIDTSFGSIPKGGQNKSDEN